MVAPVTLEASPSRQWVEVGGMQSLSLVGRGIVVLVRNHHLTSELRENVIPAIFFKVFLGARHWWLTPVILATQEAEIKRIPGKWLETPSRKTHHKTGLGEWLKW
jgi:hypothetical protein